MGSGVKNIFLIVFIFLFTAISAFAVDNSLTGIDFKTSDNNGYNITLKTDKTSQIIKSYDENDSLILTLKDTLPSDALDIIYNNTDENTNIIVQKKNRSNTVVIIQGNNIKNAQIFVKDLSTGVLKPLEAKNNLFFVADKKLLAVCLFSILIAFLFALITRPKEQRYTNVKTKELKNRLTANTLRKKNLIQSRNIPSINYKLNTSMGVPKDFVINQAGYTETEKIRKAG